MTNKERLDLNSKLDAALLSAIQETPGKRSGFYAAKVRDRIETYRAADPLRVMDRALQRLRRAEKVKHASNAWWYIES